MSNAYLIYIYIHLWTEYSVEAQAPPSPPYRICVGFLESKGWIHMKGNEDS